MRFKIYSFLYMIGCLFIGCGAGFLWCDDAKKIPIVYDDGYNIRLFGIQKLHPFDTEKYMNVVRTLIADGVINKGQLHKPKMVTDEEFIKNGVHTNRYLDSLRDNRIVGSIAEVYFISYIPNRLNFLVQRYLLNSLRLATGGTKLAASLALENGKAAVNLGGGQHHAKLDSGSGWCFFGDIQLAILNLWKKNPNLKVLIIDLDAHQGNGYADFFKKDERISIMDVYVKNNFPYDMKAKKYIDYNYPVELYIKDEEYLKKVEDGLSKAVKNSDVDFIFYNAGTDPFEKDTLGRVRISKDGLIKRDEFVFDAAKKKGIPICMVTSGGYSEESAKIIAESLKNLIQKQFIG